MDRSGSPPPLEQLLGAEEGVGVGGVGQGEEKGDDWGAAGWWLGYAEKRVWVGPEERRLMRAWAGVVTRAIGTGEWGMDGSLGWEI